MNVQYNIDSVERKKTSVEPDSGLMCRFRRKPTKYKKFDKMLTALKTNTKTSRNDRKVYKNTNTRVSFKMRTVMSLRAAALSITTVVLPLLPTGMAAADTTAATNINKNAKLKHDIPHEAQTTGKVLSSCLQSGPLYCALYRIVFIDMLIWMAISGVPVVGGGHSPPWTV